MTQDIRRRVSSCFVAIDANTGAVVGLHEMASASIPNAGLAREPHEDAAAPSNAARCPVACSDAALRRIHTGPPPTCPEK
jgi:hypothetical protein